MYFVKRQFLCFKSTVAEWQVTTRTAALFSFPINYIPLFRIYPVFAKFPYLLLSVLFLLQWDRNTCSPAQPALKLRRRRPPSSLGTSGSASSQAPLASSQSEVQRSALCKWRTQGRLTMTIKTLKGTTGCWPKEGRTSTSYSKHAVQCNATCHRLRTSKVGFALVPQKTKSHFEFSLLRYHLAVLVLHIFLTPAENKVETRCTVWNRRQTTTSSFQLRQIHTGFPCSAPPRHWGRSFPEPRRADPGGLWLCYRQAPRDDRGGCSSAAAPPLPSRPFWGTGPARASCPFPPSPPLPHLPSLSTALPPSVPRRGGGRPVASSGEPLAHSPTANGRSAHPGRDGGRPPGAHWCGGVGAAAPAPRPPRRAGQGHTRVFLIHVFWSPI